MCYLPRVNVTGPLEYNSRVTALSFEVFNYSEVYYSSTDLFLACECQAFISMLTNKTKQSFNKQILTGATVGMFC